MVIESFEDIMSTEVLRNKPGAVGCTLSHLKAIRAAYEAGDDVALILEDDAVADLAPWWSLSLEAFADSLPPGWHAAQVRV